MHLRPEPDCPAERRSAVAKARQMLVPEVQLDQFVGSPDLCAIRKIDIHLVTPQRDAEDTGFGPTEFDDSERRAECAIQETYRRAPVRSPQRSEFSQRCMMNVCVIFRRIVKRIGHRVPLHLCCKRSTEELSATSGGSGELHRRTSNVGGALLRRLYPRRCLRAILENNYRNVVRTSSVSRRFY
jgi:hypothetical protein